MAWEEYEPLFRNYRRCELYYIREELEKYGLLSLEGRLLPLIKDKCMSRKSWVT
mgnify:CR=1 FL=1